MPGIIDNLTNSASAAVDTVKSALNQGSEETKAKASEGSYESNKEIAQHGGKAGASVGDRYVITHHHILIHQCMLTRPISLSSAGDAISDKVDQKRHESEAKGHEAEKHVNKQNI